MTTIEFIKTHKVPYAKLAKVLRMCEQSVKNKVNGTGKSKPFTPAEDDVLVHFIQSIAHDANLVLAAKAASLREDLKAVTRQVNNQLES